MLGKFSFYLIDLLRGTCIMRALKELHVHQYLPQNDLDNIRKKRLDSLFSLATSRVPFYKNCKSYEEAPVLSKADVMERYEEFFVKGYKGKLSRKTTGGSTGVPFAYYTTKESVSYMWAGIILSWEMSGYKPGEKVMFLAGTSLFKNDWKHKLFYKLLNVDVLYASPLNDDIMDEYASNIKNRKAAVVYGYAYAINTMAEYLNRVNKHSFPDLKGVVCTAELLTDSARAKIERAFGVPVFDQYGCNEGGISAFECEHKNKHLISTRAIYETNENGWLISTDLFNDGFVMMKYNTTDIIRFADKKCSCKRSYPVIKEMVGRTNDVVVDMNNKVFHASFFGITLAKDTSIHQYQVTFDNDSLVLNIHSEEHNEKHFADIYIPKISEFVQFDSYEVVMNQPFEKTPNGKHREVVDKRKVKKQVYTE